MTEQKEVYLLIREHTAIGCPVPHVRIFQTQDEAVVELYIGALLEGTVMLYKAIILAERKPD